METNGEGGTRVALSVKKSTKQWSSSSHRDRWRRHMPNECRKAKREQGRD